MGFWNRESPKYVVFSQDLKVIHGKRSSICKYEKDSFGFLEINLNFLFAEPYMKRVYVILKRINYTGGQLVW